MKVWLRKKEEEESSSSTLLRKINLTQRQKEKRKIENNRVVPLWNCRLWQSTNDNDDIERNDVSMRRLETQL